MHSIHVPEHGVRGPRQPFKSGPMVTAISGPLRVESRGPPSVVTKKIVLKLNWAPASFICDPVREFWPD